MDRKVVYPWLFFSGRGILCAETAIIVLSLHVVLVLVSYCLKHGMSDVRVRQGLRFRASMLLVLARSLRRATRPQATLTRFHDPWYSPVDQFHVDFMMT